MAYDATLRARLAGELHSLTIIDRYNLVDDAWNEVVAGRLGAADFLTFVDGFTNERELAVWQAIAAGLRGVGRLIEVDKDGKLQHEIKLTRDHPSTHSDTRLVRRTPAGTYLVAHEHDGKAPQGFGLFHNGRLVVYYTYESNPSDAWNDPEVHGDSPEKRLEALPWARFCVSCQERRTTGHN